jgi:hypothetical protein
LGGGDSTATQYGHHAGVAGWPQHRVKLVTVQDASSSCLAPAANLQLVLLLLPICPGPAATLSSRYVHSRIIIFTIVVDVMVKKNGNSGRGI